MLYSKLYEFFATRFVDKKMKFIVFEKFGPETTIYLDMVLVRKTAYFFSSLAIKI